MKAYEVEYRTESGRHKLRNYLRGQFTTISETQRSIVFIQDIEDIGYKKYILYRDDNILIERAYFKSRYTLLYLIAVLSTAISLTRYFENSISFDFLMMTTGLSSVILFLYPMLLSHSNPDFFYANIENSAIFGVPVLSRTGFTTHIFIPTMLIVSLINLHPWLVPEPNLLSLILLLLFLPIYTLSTDNGYSPITVQIFTLWSIAILPFSMTLAGMQLFSQFEPINQQNITFLESYNQPFASELYHLTHDGLFASPAVIIVTSYLLTLAALIQVSPKICRLLHQTEPLSPSVEYIGECNFLRYSLFLLSIIYIGIPSIIAAFPRQGSAIIGINNTIDLMILYSPILVVVTAWVGYWIWKSLQIRRDLDSYKENTGVQTVTGEVNFILAELDGSVAVSADPLGKKPLILMDEDFADKLSDEEAAAIYYHELYHLENGITQYQKIFHVPVFGYLIFLALISPSKIHREEFAADAFAAQKVNTASVISAIEKSKSTDRGGNSSGDNLVSEQQGFLDLIRLLWDTPLLSFYRPSPEQRIKYIQEHGITRRPDP